MSTGFGTRKTFTAHRRFTRRSSDTTKATTRTSSSRGPWYHGQHFADGTRLGALNFDEDTAKRFRESVLAPFLRKFLHQESANQATYLELHSDGGHTDGRASGNTETRP